MVYVSYVFTKTGDGTYGDDDVVVYAQCVNEKGEEVVYPLNKDDYKDLDKDAALTQMKDQKEKKIFKAFLDKEARHEPQLFYLWGHTFEFDRDGNWDLIEKFAETAGGHGDDVWYATNIDIIDYIAAYRSLRWTLDMTRFTNPTSTGIWLTVGVDGVYRNYTAAPGETVDVTT